MHRCIRQSLDQELCCTIVRSVSQHGPGSSLGFPGKEKKNPGDAVVAWENKQLPRQLKKKSGGGVGGGGPIGRQVRRRRVDFTATLGKTVRRVRSATTRRVFD